MSSQLTSSCYDEPFFLLFVARSLFKKRSGLADQSIFISLRSGYYKGVYTNGSTLTIKMFDVKKILSRFNFSWNTVQLSVCQVDLGKFRETETK